jgi:hypothetical protein
MFLSNPVSLNNYVQTACLPTSQSSTIPAANLTGVAVGWGTTSLSGSRPGYLSNVRVDIYSETACIGFGYDPVQGYSYNVSLQVCAGIYFLMLINRIFLKFLKDFFSIKVM